MRIIISLMVWLIVALYSYQCSSGNSSDIVRYENGLLQNRQINEASGLDASWINADVLWTHNDSGDQNRIFAIDTRGNDLGTFYLAGISNRDWEDIAVGPGPQDGQAYIYVAEIGDNRAVYDTKYIYRIPEPMFKQQSLPVDTTLEGVQTIAFRYPDGPRDAETLMIDPLSRDLYVISKREEQVRVYRLAFPQVIDSVTTAEYLLSLPITMVTAGDISDDGRDIIIKNYDQIFYWRRDVQQSVSEVLAMPPDTLPYVVEPQGEALCWSADGQGYFTLSEEAKGIRARLYYYPFNRSE